MPETQYRFYECENPGCQLRFPGYEGFSKGNRCPLCRSNTHIVAFVDNLKKRSKREYLKGDWQYYVLLDNIRSALNVGSIFRTSDGMGISKIYICGISPNPDNSKVSKTALGAEVTIPWEQSNNALNTVITLKSKGLKIWALEDLPFAEPLYNLKVTSQVDPVVLIVGNEVNGVDPGIIELCDKVISIPMLGKKSSYNVATAFGIAASYLVYCQNFSQGSLKTLPST
jgi:23S rRNA (guanosine2251-2'-O)-methyltransferase